jgi:uncharacterized repeat protein (TIGR01451 family)
MAHKIVSALLAATAALTPALAVAADGPLQIASKIFVEQRALAADGTVRTTLVPAVRAVPGDHVVFVLAYRNTGKAALQDIVLNNPVPGAIVYRTVGDKSAAPELSVDGKTFGTLAQLRVSAAGASRAATPNDVRHVRWRLATIPAGGQGQLAFKAVLK